MALNSHTSGGGGGGGGGYWHSILTPPGATGTGARDTGATGMLPFTHLKHVCQNHVLPYIYIYIYIGLKKYLFKKTDFLNLKSDFFF